MVFSSVVFMLYFLPVTVGIYYLAARCTSKSFVKNFILLIASLVFYAWGEPIYIVLMLISIYFNYIIGRDIDDARSRADEKRAKAAFVISIVFNLGVLGFFKYYGFVIDNINSIFKTEISVTSLSLPVGISFYTFQIMSYVIDLYRGKVKVQKNLLNFAVYISLFPQLIAGPIVRYADIAWQLKNRRETMQKFTDGMIRFVRGLAKKVLFANTMGALYETIQGDGAGSISTVTAWIGIIAYTLQIYFDFSGYSDMAIGLGKIFGFEFCENFNYPYIASSVTDFWRRWHISLSSWFREYVYIPLGGNRRSTPRVILNLLIVWSLTGLWHGAAWNFIAWGFYYGIILILEKYLFKSVIKKIPPFVMHIVTMLIVMIGWVLFSSETFAAAFDYLSVMFGASGTGFTDSQANYYLVSYGIFIVIASVFATPLPSRMVGKLKKGTANKLSIIVYPLILILCIIFMVSETYNPFLYFRF